MHQRCGTKRATKGHKDYAGRGITVAAEWQAFEVFFRDMGHCPDKFQLDRIDNNGNYSKANCRWVSAAENLRNKRTTRKLTHDGQTLCLSEWAREFGVSRQALHEYIKKNGWEQAATHFK